MIFNNKEHLIIRTSINNEWQLKAQQLSKFLNFSETEIGLISIQSDSGLIRVMISGKNSELNEFNRVTSAIRPLGSTFKVIPYLLALQEGITEDFIFIDEPTCWKNYCPKNFEEIYRGEISMIDSFKFSSNIVAIKIAEKIGLENIIKTANLFGLGNDQKIEEFYPLAIGAYGDSLINITNVYATINNNGNLLTPTIIESIESINGEIIWEHKLNPIELIEGDVVISLNKLLENSVSEGSGIAASIIGEKIYGKTGTSDDNKDLWFIGSIDNITTGIWLGNDNNKSSIFSSGDAAYLWKVYIKSIKESFNN